MAHRLAPEAVPDCLVDSVTTRFFLLARYPRAGRQRDDIWPGMRIFPVGDYVVLYRIEGNDVLIARVIRGSRDLETLFGE